MPNVLRTMIRCARTLTYLLLALSVYFIWVILLLGKSITKIELSENSDSIKGRGGNWESVRLFAVNRNSRFQQRNIEKPTRQDIEVKADNLYATTTEANAITSAVYKEQTTSLSGVVLQTNITEKLSAIQQLDSNINESGTTFAASTESIPLATSTLTASVIDLIESLKSTENHVSSSVDHTNILESTINPDTNVPSEMNHLNNSIMSIIENATIGIFYLVCSRPDNFAARLAMRKTWLSRANPVPLVFQKRVFVTGNVDNTTLKRNLSLENDTYGDMIRVNVTDNYFTLTRKTILAMAWVLDNVRGFHYIVKVDDDAFVNIFNLAEYLLAERPSRKILGYKCTNVPPQRNKDFKWYLSEEEFPDKVFPAFAAGWAYTVAFDGLRELHEAALKAKFLYLEDIFFTGVARSLTNITVIGHSGFRARINATDLPAVKEFFGVHFVEVADHYAIWKSQLFVRNDTGEIL